MSADRHTGPMGIPREGRAVRGRPRLAAAVESHLAELAMAGARLAVAVDGDAGEQVTFRLAANPGHEPLPLSRVASGGELARVMLALRLVLTAGPPTRCSLRLSGVSLGQISKGGAARGRLLPV